MKERQEKTATRRANLASEKAKMDIVLVRGDPLYGVLNEEQVGIDPLSGRPKIAKEVLDDMRNYLRAASDLDIAIREERVKTSVREVKMDPVAKRTVLRLEPAPILISDVNKKKGPVFDYGELDVPRKNFDLNKNPPKLMASAIKANRSFQAESDQLFLTGATDHESEASFASIFSVPPTVFKSGALVPDFTGTSRKRGTTRKRPGKAARNAKLTVSNPEVKKPEFTQRDGKQQVGSKRRSVTLQEEEITTTTQAKCLKVIPHEGLPNPQ